MSDQSILYLRPPVWALLTAVVIAGLFYLQGKNMESRAQDPNRGTISVSADAKVSVAPDIAELTFGVSTGRHPTAKTAMEKLKKNMNAIVDALKQLDIAEKDISTTSLWLNPAYDYEKGTQVPRGFEASQNLTVKVRDMDSIGEVLNAVTQAGANQVGGVSFTIDDPEKARNDAREKAIAKAKNKARDLASALGVALGDLKGFSEGGDNYPRPMMMSKGMDMAEASLAVPVGEQDVSVTVTLTYELR